MKNIKNKKLIFLLGTITILFLLIILYLVYFEIFKSDKLNKHVLNPRNSVDETKNKRGSIFDSNGVELASSVLKDEKYTRKYKYDYLYSNIIGYNSQKYGKSGLELFYNNELLNISRNLDIFDKVENIYKKDEPSNLHLTIDDKIQSYAYDVLGKSKGVVLVANPKTGEILSMVSKPSFNINKIESNWENIIKSEDAILLNRATQGLYEPGSVFKVLTSIAILRSGIDQNYNDTGSATIAGNTVRNVNKNVYGKMDLEKALNVSANTYFFEKSQKISNDIFSSVVKDFGINKKFDFPLLRNNSKIPFKSGLSNIEKAYASFGQGKTYINPLDMLLIGMGIANDGVVMKPKIVNKIENGKYKKEIPNEILSNSIKSDDANTIKSYLESTAKSNGVRLKNGISIAGKTGSAETSGNKNHLWYLSMAPSDNPEYVVLVLLENSDGLASKLAVPKSVSILNYIFSK